MSFSAVNVSNNILKRAFDEGVPVSPMKLQKILYFVASEYAKRSNAPLLSEQFQAWRYGPVVRSVYDEYRSFGAAPIRAYGKDARGVAYMADEAKDANLSQALDAVWQSVKGRSAVELSRITHLPDSAWAKAYGGTYSNNPLGDRQVQEDVSYRAELGITDR